MGETVTLTFCCCHADSWQFDMNDDEKTFTRELIRKAPTSPILLTAILALASRHLATVSSFDSKIADHYSEECTTEMISCLNNRDESKNDDLFAATIILRTKEEMDGQCCSFLLCNLC